MTRWLIRRLLQAAATFAVVAVLLAIPVIFIAVRELTPAGKPVTTIEGEGGYTAPTQQDIDAKLADLKAKADEKAKEQTKKIKLPKDGLLVTYEGINPGRTQTHYAFYYPADKTALLD